MAAGVVADDRADRLRDLVEVGDQLLDRQLAERIALEGLVGVCHVGGVVLVVVDFHGAGIDEGLERVEGVGERRERVGHEGCSPGDEGLRIDLRRGPPQAGKLAKRTAAGLPRQIAARSPSTRPPSDRPRRCGCEGL
jgi:hypothetical protein